MEKVLVINCGSSSIKFQLINMANHEVIAKGLAERIGIEGSCLNYSAKGEKHVVEQKLENHSQGIDLIVKYLTSDDKGVIKDKKEISAIGHRVVHAGEKYTSTVKVDDEVLANIRDCFSLAPLHNPPNLTGIEACKKNFGDDMPMTCVFDNVFHMTMPQKAYMYAIPYEFYKKHSIRKYGFHGTSHFYVAKEGAKAIGKNIEDLKIITCHLGNGSSITAVKNGKSIDTSMGFTPLAGVVMGTRCGDVDPAIINFLCEKENLSVSEVDTILNKKSGIHGISGISSDMRDIEDGINKGDEKAKLAFDMLVYSIKKYIGAYVAIMNGVDLIIFTAGIGENDVAIRREVLKDMDYFGVKISEEANNKRFSEAGVISSKDSKVLAMVIPTNEELEIAMQTVDVLK